MADRKIIAYYINEAEKEIILRKLDAASETDIFIIGKIKDGQERELVEQGILFNFIERDQDDKIINKDRDNNKGLFKIANYEEFEYQFSRNEFFGRAYYLLRILGPLLQDYSQYLKRSNIQVIELRPPDLYVVWINNRRIFQELKSYEFIDEIMLITGRDTPLTIIDRARREALDIPAGLEKKMLPFDVILHREKDMDNFLALLKSFNIQIAGFSEKKVRIYLLEDDITRFYLRENIYVREIYEFISPKLHNDFSKQVIGLSPIAAPLASSPYSGQGQIIGVADSGIDVSHIDFQGRIAGMQDWGGLGIGIDYNGHGTHVAGTVLGDGTASSGTYKGAAPQSTLYFQSLLNNEGKLTFPFNLKDLFNDAYQKGVRIHNNSWGSSTSSRINAQAIEADEFVFENPDMLLVFSAGNAGKSIDGINVPAGHVDYYSIGAPGTAKNILTVGSSRSSRPVWGYSQETYSNMWPEKFNGSTYYNIETVSGNEECLAAFSSRGPSDDDRIKPDIVAPGTDIVSTRSAQSSPSNFWAVHPTNNQYAIMGGTSMSAPLVTGCAAVIRQYYLEEHTHKPSAALLKATIINGAKKLTGIDAGIVHPGTPNFNQGFGMIDMLNSIPTHGMEFFFHFTDNYLEPSKHLRTGNKFSVSIELKSRGWIRACLVYTDLPARALQNNLNLLVSDSGAVNKWLGNDNAQKFMKGLDTKNNVECVIIEDAQPDIYTITVIGQNIIKNAQDFALIITASEDTIIV